VYKRQRSTVADIDAPADEAAAPAAAPAPRKLTRIRRDPADGTAVPPAEGDPAGR
jgi:hypothetical protein